MFEVISRAKSLPRNPGDTIGSVSKLSHGEIKLNHLINLFIGKKHT
jgi:hypothetical protein